MTGLLARFDAAEALAGAIRALRAEGRAVDAFMPYPAPEVTGAIGTPTERIGWTAALAALAGGAITFAAIAWMAAVDYPLNVGGRPLFDWPAFLPPALVAAALWSGAATLLAMLRWCGLPRWHQPLFGASGFDDATWDRFFLLLGEPRPGDGDRLRALGADAVEEVEL